MLVPAKLAPGRVELAGHAKEIKRQVAGILGRHGEVVVTPAPGWQRLQFEVAEVGEKVMSSARDIAGVVEDRHIGAQ